ncbi:unnamed protein product [Phytophthora fragariaefolia]|uniref:Unnamed protein product n=1 Tax=Phytophthora fragariaefolia TaxID=1490495 RepID=A0A9W7D413_9STRA|nr:unnamed protein product [Phytophthora fragariaefolia]
MLDFNWITLYSLGEEDFNEYVTQPDVREQERWKHVENAFEGMYTKVADAPMLKHYDPERESVVIVYSSDWASTAVVQEHAGRGREISLGIAAHSVQLFYDAGREDNQGANTAYNSGVAVQMQRAPRSVVSVGRHSVTMDT